MTLRTFLAAAWLFSLIALLVLQNYRISRLEEVVQKNAYVLGYTSEVGADVCTFSLDGDTNKVCLRPKVHYIFTPTFGK
jgi:hypothetical protein